MKIRYFFAAATAICMSFSLLAAERSIPSGYYTRIDGKKAADLKTAVSDAISRHTVLSYSSLWDYYPQTDTYPGGTQWWDMYSDEVRYVRNGNSGMNKEHCVPNSWWGGKGYDAYSDLHHLFPSDSQGNNRKSNFPLSEISTVSWTNGVTTVGKPVSGQGGGASWVFEPDDRYKGDMARAYLYVVTCYQTYSWVERVNGLTMFNTETYPTLKKWAIDLLLKWSREDPVSQKEIDRNEAVYRIQGNRNPFVDFPGIEEYIWGSRKNEAFVLADHMNGEVIDPVNPPVDPVDPVDPIVKEGKLTSPAQDFVLEFGQVAVGKESYAHVLLRGENLDEAKGLELLIYDMNGTDDASLFTIDGLPKATVSTTAVNSPDGLSVRVDYKPKAVGEHQTYLVARRGGLKEAVSIYLHGEALPMPQLSTPVALPATDITATSYTANWQPLEGEDVDHYILNRTKYVNGTAETEPIEVEDATSYVITDFCGNESYTVQAVRLDVASEESNTVLVTPSSITGVDAGLRFGISSLEDGIMIHCSDRVARLAIYEPSGRLVRMVNDAANNDIISLPAGLYIVRASGAAAPIKVIVGSN